MLDIECPTDIYYFIENADFHEEVGLLLQSGKKLEK